MGWKLMKTVANKLDWRIHEQNRNRSEEGNGGYRLEKANKICEQGLQFGDQFLYCTTLSTSYFTPAIINDKTVSDSKRS